MANRPALAAVVALGSFERVDTAAAEMPIVPRAAVDEVLPAVADQGVGEGGSRATVHPVPAVVTADQVFVPGAAVDEIDS